MNQNGIPLSEAVIPRAEKAMPADFPDEPFLGLDDVEAHTTRLLGSKPSALMKSAAKRFYPGDVLYSRLRPYLNKVWLADRSGLCSSEFIVLPANKDFNGAFLKYRLNAMDFVSFANSLNAGDRPRVDFDQIGSFQLPPFSISYQKRIVAKIEELFSELEAGEESLRVARRQLGVYRQSLLKQAFEGHLTAQWRTQNPAKLESPAQLLARIQSARQARYEEQLAAWERAVTSWSKGGQKGKRPTKPSEPAIFDPKDFDGEITVPGCWAVEQIGNCPTDSLIGLVRSADEQTAGPTGFSYIKMDRVDMGGNVDIAPEVFVACTADEVERFALRKGDILFNTRNSIELVGKVGIVRRDPESLTVYNNNLMRIRLPECLDPVFVGLQLCAQPFRQRMEHVKKATTSVAAVYAKDFWPLPLAICSLPEQQEIVRLLDEQFEVIERNEREIDGALRKSEALRQAILQKAFTGRLVPQSPSDEPAAELLARLRAEEEVATEATLRLKKAADTGDWFPEVAGSKKRPRKPRVARRPGTTDLQAGIVAMAIDRFGRRNQFLGHTNAEKIVHLADCLADLQLDRRPVKDAAGPNDFKRAKEIEHRARAQGWFRVTKDGAVYHYHPGRNLPFLLEATERTLGSKFAIVENLLEQLRDLKDTRSIEIFATVYAAWNNLLLRKATTSEEAIVTEARENWHAKKLAIDRKRFFGAIAWMKRNGFVPNGTGRLVDKPRTA